jgi:hypothetical protein
MVISSLSCLAEAISTNPVVYCCVAHQDAHQDHFKCTKMVPFWEKPSCKCRSKRIMTEHCTLSAGLPYSFLSLAQDLSQGLVQTTRPTACHSGFTTSFPDVRSERTQWLDQRGEDQPKQPAVSKSDVWKQNEDR